MKIVSAVFISILVLFVIVFIRYKTRDDETKGMVRRVVNYPIVNVIAKNATFNKNANTEKQLANKNVVQVKPEKVKGKQYSNIVETIEFEQVTDEVKGEDLFALGESFLGFVRKYPDEVTFFKTDFSPIFDRKVGDEVSFIVGDRQYLGVIDTAYIQHSSELDLKPEIEYTYYDFRIRPYSQIEENDSTYYINIGGTKFNNGDFKYFGNIKYEPNDHQRFQIDSKIGVIVPDRKFDYYLSVDMGSGLD